MDFAHNRSGVQDVIRGTVTSSSTNGPQGTYQAPIPPVAERVAPPSATSSSSASAAPLRLPRKSLLLAGLLGLVLGPLGMIYSTLFGAFVMMGVVFWGAILTGFQALPGLLLWCALWSVWGAHRTNERRRAMEAYLSYRA